MGSVFKVFDESLSSHLALKRPTRSATGKDRALFEREYHTLSGMRHPHIVEVYDYGTDAEGPFYTMELLLGGDLSNASPLPWPEACRILRDTASALALLHARRLIHRDLSARNLWRCPDGRIKLIDFGALAAFGTARDVAGTPPFIAPEALHGEPLDQRTDLYSLGALGYWLLTARHAFAARELYELDELWRRAPRSPSSCVQKLERPDLPPVPPALDALIEALLSRDPLGRPSSAGEVIERLVAVAKLPSEQNASVVDSYLGSTSFVGRREQREALSAALERSRGEHATSVVVAAESGLGRSRLLHEFALEARLKGFIVLHADAQSGGRGHAAVSSLSVRVLDALPGLAKDCAALLGPTLGHLSPELARRLGLNAAALSPMPHAPGEARMRIQAALRDWFLAIARAQPIAILVDDLESIDEASLAWLAAVAHSADSERLLIVATLRQEPDVSHPLAVEALRQQASTLGLAPLTLKEMRELLRSMFGEAVHLERVSELLFRLSGGSPAKCMELAEYLVKHNLALYLNGSWVLPQTLEEAQLPATQAEMLAARLRRLPADARALGQVLSIHAHSIPLEVCARVSGLPYASLFSVLETLVKEGVLSGAADGYRFCDDGMRRTLLAELDPERSRHAHKVLGEILLASNGGSTREQLEAGVHLLLGGE
ncbi:MAG TPA: protein kinase, partial [Polyangiaceae bacterium]|nr:protein kinase [Polyangiaceae bacterium]